MALDENGEGEKRKPVKLPPKKGAARKKAVLPPKKKVSLEVKEETLAHDHSQASSEQQVPVSKLLILIALFLSAVGIFFWFTRHDEVPAEIIPEVSQPEVQQPRQIPSEAKRAEPSGKGERTETVSGEPIPTHNAAHDDKIRIATFNVRDFSAMTEQAVQYQAMSRHVSRFRPDILALQEISARSIELITSTFAQAQGYRDSYFGKKEDRGIVILSKYPILFSEMVESPVGSHEFARNPRYVELDVFGRRIGVYGIHKATWAQNYVDTAKPQFGYNRAVETERIRLHMAERRTLHLQVEFVIMGDHNEGPGITHPSKFEERLTINNLPVGRDIRHPILVGNPPFDQLAAAGIRYLRPADGSGKTFTLLGGGDPNPQLLDKHRCQIDFIGHSRGLRTIGSELVNSEAPVRGGLEKYGNQLSYEDSRLASDHLMVVADFARD